MNRRDFSLALGAAAGLGVLAPGTASAAKSPTPAASAADGPSFAMLVHPKMILLDLVGPLTVFNVMGARIHLVGRTPAPVASEVGIPVTPTTTYPDCPRDVDVLFVPGGLGGTVDLMDDPGTIAFLREMGERARFVTAVCTGTLLLGAAGLIRSKRATTHWYVRDLLPLFGGVPTEERVVEDGNLVTGGGATAGVDFGLTLAARMKGEDAAKRIQLVLEYDPKPPFPAGSPAGAGADITAEVLRRRGPALQDARRAAERAAARMPA
ncbi:DJ-1/PfpI family protein [Aureimonas sp. Leaf324]|uniref:DJ-1/PfpI family protein n=1 Tax=Aureimonas sp. Leaf324 TaxID=1736336 RepID=UPI0006FF2254|nr:DJ-1/PfpI family protein [Aureimonas sp. Leaf324]KQQ91033.1 thiamine biosynthesis protein ThiJ [Aureimonas sp. Leaf324]